ncbi:hypothetical protein ACN47A_03830 [Myxococcus fulvus]|uniref:hypothetical protein n=1 Tax=Myxococcus fulvus TaxID=33 RepID=UPI003B990F49
MSVVLVLWSTGCQHSGRSATTSRGAERTFAHQILDLEEELGTVTPAMRELVDALEEEARTRIKLPSSKPSREQVLGALQQMHDILSSKGFMVAPTGYVEFLTEALTPVELIGAELESLKSSDYTQGARRAWLTAQTNDDGVVVYLADCDTLSFLYLTMGDAIGLPLSLAERRSQDGGVGHNWVQWRQDGQHLSWETLDGAKKGSKGTPQSRAATRGYVRKLIANEWRIRGNEHKAAQHYAHSLEDFPDPTSFDHLAWILATSPDPSIRDAHKARALAMSALQEGCEYDRIGTLAAAHAASGSFGNAVTLQTIAIALAPEDSPLSLAGLKYRLALYQRGIPFIRARHGRELDIRRCIWITDELLKQGTIAASAPENTRASCAELDDLHHQASWREIEATVLQKEAIVLPAHGHPLPSSCTQVVRRALVPADMTTAASEATEVGADSPSVPPP